MPVTSIDHDEHALRDALDRVAGLFAPAGTPPAVLDKLAGAVREALGVAEVRASLTQAGFQLAPSSREAFAASLAKQQAQWAEIVRRLGLRVE